MKIQEAYQIIKQDLILRLGEREATSVATILIEDLFSLKPPWRHQSLPLEQTARFQQARKSLKDGIPVQYVTGKAHFYGMELFVNTDVLIPRPETEELVYRVLKWCGKKKLKIIDFGTGSGCIALALKKEAPWLQVSAVDISQAALDLARQNGENLGLEIHWMTGNVLESQFWSALPAFDVLVSNPPYIPLNEWDIMDPHVREHEPRRALFTNDQDGMEFYQSIAENSVTNLSAEGRIFLECNALRAKPILQLFTDKNYHTQLHKDLNGMDRILEAWLGN